MKASFLLAAVLLVAACSSSSSTGSSAGDAAGARDSASAGGDAGAGDGSGDELAAPDTWASWGQGFFTRYCDECHSVSDPQGLDFGVQATVVANKDAIRCGVAATQDPGWSCPSTLQAKQFPISDSSGTNPKPTDAERDRVVAWIGAGCP